MTRRAAALPWPPAGTPAGPGAHAWIGTAGAGAPPPPSADCVGLWLPPIAAAHTDAAGLRRWCVTAAESGCRAVYRAEAAPQERRRYRLAVSFAHVCRVLGAPAALEVPAAAAPPAALTDVLERWPELRVTIQTQDVEGLAAARARWAERLWAALVPAPTAAAVHQAWGEAGGWVVVRP